MSSLLSSPHSQWMEQWLVYSKINQKQPPNLRENRTKMHRRTNVSAWKSVFVCFGRRFALRSYIYFFWLRVALSGSCSFCTSCDSGVLCFRFKNHPIALFYANFAPFITKTDAEMKMQGPNSRVRTNAEGLTIMAKPQNVMIGPLDELSK